MFTQFLSFVGTGAAVVVLVAMAISAVLPDIWEHLPTRRERRPCLSTPSAIGVEAVHTRS